MFTEERRERDHASGDQTRDHDLHKQRQIIDVIG
jgi:hypothetical protein